MDRFTSLQLFVQIVELGSFRRAADRLEMPAATATNAIKDLESRLGARLLQRTTRSVRPTQDGQAYYERCVNVLSELEDAEAALQHVASNPRGTLRLDMHGIHASQIVLPRIDAFHRLYPGIRVVVSSGDRLIDLVREGVDCVVRAGAPRDSSLVVRPLAVMPQVLCASPEYLARHGTPREPGELSAHQTVKFFASNGGVDYPIELLVDGKLRNFRLEGWMSVNDASNYVACGLRGCGLIQLPRYSIEEHLRDGRLVEVLEQCKSPSMQVSALYPYHRQLAPRVRVFIDWVRTLYEEKFGPLPAGGGEDELT